MNYFLDVLKNKYAKFDGRATRSEYWFFTLFTAISYMVTMLMDYLLVNFTGGIPILTILTMLGMIVPSIAVSVRRLHDIGKSGWWYLLALIPYLSLVLIIFFVMDSKDNNIYGDKPIKI